MEAEFLLPCNGVTVPGNRKASAVVFTGSIIGYI